MWHTLKTAGQKQVAHETTRWVWTSTIVDDDNRVAAIKTLKIGKQPRWLLPGHQVLCTICNGGGMMMSPPRWFVCSFIPGNTAILKSLFFFISWMEETKTKTKKLGIHWKYSTIWTDTLSKPGVELRRVSMKTRIPEQHTETKTQLKDWR